MIGRYEIPTPQQIIEMNREMFCAIPREEFLLLDANKCPFYAAYVKNTNRLTSLVQNEVLQHDTAEARAESIKRWVGIMDECHRHKDYVGVIAISGALQAASLHRLELTKMKLPLEIKNKMDFFENLLKQSKALQSEMEKKEGDVIPYLGIYSAVIMRNKEKKALAGAGVISSKAGASITQEVVVGMQERSRPLLEEKKGESPLKRNLDTMDLSSNERVLLSKSKSLESADIIKLMRELSKLQAITPKANQSYSRGDALRTIAREVHDALSELKIPGINLNTLLFDLNKIASFSAMDAKVLKRKEYQNLIREMLNEVKIIINKASRLKAVAVVEAKVESKVESKSAAKPPAIPKEDEETKVSRWTVFPAPEVTGDEKVSKGKVVDDKKEVDEKKPVRIHRKR